MLTTVYFKPRQCASNTHTPDSWALCSAISASLAAHPCTASGSLLLPSFWPSALQSPSRSEATLGMFSHLSWSSLLLSFASVGTNLFLSYTPVSDFLTHWERWTAIFSGYCLHSAISCRTVSTGPGPSHHPQVSPLCIEISWSDFHTSIYLCGVIASSKWKYLYTQNPNSQEHPRYFQWIYRECCFCLCLPMVFLLHIEQFC